MYSVNSKYNEHTGGGMKKIEYVSTREELKRALENKSDYIVITDKSLAKNVSIVKSASYAALAATIAGSGVTATMWWNPVGWVAATTTIAISGTLAVAVIFLIAILGSVLIYALWKNYKIIGKGKYTLPDGTSIEGEVILTPS